MRGASGQRIIVLYGVFLVLFYEFVIAYPDTQGGCYVAVVQCCAPAGPCWADALAPQRRRDSRVLVPRRTQGQHLSVGQHNNNNDNHINNETNDDDTRQTLVRTNIAAKRKRSGTVRGGGFAQNIRPPGDPVSDTAFFLHFVAVGSICFRMGCLIFLSASLLTTLVWRFRAGAAGWGRGGGGLEGAFKKRTSSYLDLGPCLEKESCPESLTG